MISHTTESFRREFSRLPQHIQRQAREAYRLFTTNPHHPSLRFKLVHPNRPIYSVRITRDYRALGVRQEDQMVWFWIGSHAEYEGMLSRM